MGIRAAECLSRYDGTHAISKCYSFPKIKYLTPDLMSNIWNTSRKTELRETPIKHVIK